MDNEVIFKTFVRLIADLEICIQKIQTLSFMYQNIVFEADVRKSADDTRLLHLYAMTSDLEALPQLEEVLRCRLEDYLLERESSDKELFEKSNQWRIEVCYAL